MPTSSTFCISRERPPFQSSPGEQSPPSSHTGGASLSFCFLGLLLGLLGLHRGLGTRSPVWELVPTEIAKFQSGMCCGPGGWGLSPALVLMSNQFHGNWCCLIKIKNSFIFFLSIPKKTSETQPNWVLSKGERMCQSSTGISVAQGKKRPSQRIEGCYTN